MDRGGVLDTFGRLAACLALAVLVGCGQSPQPAAISASASRASATPSPSATLPTSSTQTASVFGTCRLPVIVPHTRTEADPWAGWLDVPGGTYSPDPSSNLAGATTLAWDAVVGKWLPTEPSYISPDGLDYVASGNVDLNIATAARIPSIQIVDARTDDIVQRTSIGNLALNVVGYTRSAVYLNSTGIYPPPGLWRIDTASGTLTQVSSANGDWEVVDDTAAWGTSTTPDNIVTVKRLDLSTGAVTDVYKPPAGSIAIVAGFAGSGVVVTISSPGGNGSLSVVVIHQDGSVLPVDVPAAMHYGGLDKAVQDGPALIFSAGLSSAWPPLPDSHRVGLAAYDPAHGLQLLMSNTPPDMFLLGRCMSP